jgi:hypothetical protein
MRHLKTVSVYLKPNVIEAIDAARKNISRSSWIAYKLNKIVNEEK